MNQYKKRLFLKTCQSTAIADLFTFSTEIDALQLNKILKLRDILKDTGAQCIYLQTEGIWSTYEYQQENISSEDETLIEQMQLDATEHGATYVVVSMVGIHFSTLLDKQVDIEIETETVPYVALKNDDNYDPTELEPLLSLYSYAYAVDGLWKNFEHVHWQNAEDLIGMLKSLPDTLLGELKAIKPLISYAESTDEWESGYVRLWPEQIIKCLEHYFYGDEIKDIL